MAAPAVAEAVRLLPAGLEAEDEEEEELLAALEESLEELEEELLRGVGDGPSAAVPAAAAVPRSEALGSGTAGGSARAPEGVFAKSLGYGLVHWPLEVRILVVSFLPWQELLRDSRLCWAWRKMELEDVLWQVFFQTTWPRWTRRREANEEEAGMPWRSLFRTRWVKCKHTEDALEEDWLDFSAAQDLSSGSSPSGPSAAAIAAAAASEPTAGELQRSLRRCREDLRRAAGVAVPAEVDRGHFCSRKCKFHRLDVGGDFFLCEGSGALHRCRESEPCDLCVNDDDHSYLVCPVSGRCFHQLAANSAEAEQQGGESAGAPAWDPELSMTEQHGRWFEQGYFMSEDQAKLLFGLGGRQRRSTRHPACRA